MKKLTALMALVLLSMPLLAQFSLSGIVKDSGDQNALPGANVFIEGTFQGVHTDSNGRFIFSGLRSGTYTLVVSYVGYQSREMLVNLQNDTQVEIILDRAAVMSQEVLVRATRADGRTPLTHSNVSRREIQAANLGQDLPFLLSLTPSVVVSSDAGAGIGYTSLNIRGSDQSRINVTLNGIPINDSESHGVFWVNMPDIASSTDNIQIQRGVGTSTQGAAAFGATISLQTTDLQEKAYAELFSSAGSFNTLRNTVSLGSGLLGGKWALDGRVSYITSDGYVDRASSDLRSYYVSGGYYGDNTIIKAISFSGKEKTYQAWNGVSREVMDTNRRYNPSGLYYDELGNKRYYDNETDNYQQDHYQLHISQMISPDFNASLSMHYTYGRGYYEQFRNNDRFSRYGLPNLSNGEQIISRSDMIRQRWLDNHFYGWTYSLNYNGINNLSALIGGGSNIYDGDHFGDIIWVRATDAFDDYRYYDNNGRKSDFNSFIKLNYELLNGLNLFGDIQYRNIEYTIEGLGMVNNVLTDLNHDASFNFWNPKAGVLYDITNEHQVYLYYGISNREPVRRDFTESSPESRPRHETLRNLEAGYRLRGSNYIFGANLYYMNYKDQLVLTGEINDVGGFSRTNIDKSFRRGVELEAAYTVLPNLQLAGNITLSENKIPEFTEFSDAYDLEGNWIGYHEQTYTNTDLAFSPSIISAGALTYKPIAPLTVSILSKYVSRQYVDNTMNADRMLSAYNVNDLKVSYIFQRMVGRELEFTLAVNNILNKKYITNAWIYKGAVNNDLITMDSGYFPQATRNFLVGLRLRI